jgi:hypothetical protein
VKNQDVCLGVHPEPAPQMTRMSEWPQRKVCWFFWEGLQKSCRVLSCERICTVPTLIMGREALRTAALTLMSLSCVGYKCAHKFSFFRNPFAYTSLEFLPDTLRNALGYLHGDRGKPRAPGILPGPAPPTHHPPSPHRPQHSAHRVFTSMTGVTCSTAIFQNRLLKSTEDTDLKPRVSQGPRIVLRGSKVLPKS